MLLSARGRAPSLAEAIAGAPIRGSWWSHPKARRMYHIFREVCDSDDVLVCRLVGGKITLIHRRLWPALARVAGELPAHAIAAVREEHMPSGRHRTWATPFRRWVPPDVLRLSKRLTEREALEQLGESVSAELTREPRARGRRASRLDPTE